MIEAIDPPRRSPKEPRSCRAPSTTIPNSAAAPGSGVLKFLGCLGLIVLASLFLFPGPFRSGGREAARRAQCINNLKQIALAMHNYTVAHDALPPACTVDANGRRLHSWRVLLLPYLEQVALYKTIDLSKPWDDPVNASALAAMPGVYDCPSGSEPKNTTTYLASVAPSGCLIPGKPRRLAEITDGTARTILAIEVGEKDAVPWMAPVDADEALILGLLSGSKFAHPGGMNAAMADGSVKVLNGGLSADILRALISIAGKDGPADGQF